MQRDADGHGEVERIDRRRDRNADANVRRGFGAGCQAVAFGPASSATMAGRGNALNAASVTDGSRGVSATMV